MNRQIVRLSLGALALITALIVATTYWQTWASAGLADRQDNSIQRVAQFKIRRGLIYAADGKTVLANVPSPRPVPPKPPFPIEYRLFTSW